MLLQKKWRNIRDSYSRELNKQRQLKSGSVGKNHRKYVYFDRLQFLSNLYESKLSNSGTNEQSDSPVTDSSVIASSSKIKKASSSNDETNKILKLLAERMQNKNNANADNFEDGDRYFLSLLNDLKKNPEHRKMDAKYEIIGIIRKYVGSSSYAADYYEQQGYYTGQSSEYRSQAHAPSTELQQQSPMSNTSTNSDFTLYEDLFSDGDTV